MDNRDRMKMGFTQYWKRKLRESWNNSWDKWGMWGIIFPALASLLFALLTNRGKSLSVILGKNWLLYGLIFLGLYLLTVAVFVVREPFVLHNMQQVQIEELKK